MLLSPLTIYLLGVNFWPSADVFCKWLSTKPGPTKYQAWSGYKLFVTLVVILKEFFGEKKSFCEISADNNKEIPAYKELTMSRTPLTAKLGSFFLIAWLKWHKYIFIILFSVIDSYHLYFPISGVRVSIRFLIYLYPLKSPIMGWFTGHLPWRNT